MNLDDMDRRLLVMSLPVSCLNLMGFYSATPLYPKTGLGSTLTHFRKINTFSNFS
jgi:hypothetical protein